MKKDTNPVEDSAMACSGLIAGVEQLAAQTPLGDEPLDQPRSAATGQRENQRLVFDKPTTIQSSLKLQPYKRTKTLLIATVLLQAALICAPAIPRTLILNTGKTVVLKTVPVDPYDIFRGEYVSLKYDISTATTPGVYAKDSDVYVVLEPKGAYWAAKKVCLSKPIVGPNEVLIKGKTRNSQIRYGIEQVYVPETKGLAIERSGELTAHAKVDADGNAVLQRVETKAGRIVYDAKSVDLFNRQF